MENLHLREELRRLQAFVEEGEREMLNEQITVLQDKLLEALDWKHMHEKDTEAVQDQLSLTWDTAVNEENEFLSMQAIQTQKEVDTLRKNLTFCLEAKEKLERRVDELVSQLNPQNCDDQTELKTMVDAIAAASHREAEAHETAIVLAKENEELREKLNVLIADNNKLIGLYESAAAAAGDVELLQHQLREMHEENDKLLGLYEKAMLERDAYQRKFAEVETLRASIDAQEQRVGLKQRELTSLRTVAENKLRAMKEAVRCVGAIHEKKEELIRLESACTKAKSRESGIRCEIERLRAKYREGETQKKETEKVLFAIENNNKPANYGKAWEMLKSEEERSGILVEIKRLRERLGAAQKEVADSRKGCESVELEIESGMRALGGVGAEKMALGEMEESGVSTELGRILVEYQEGIFESDLKEEEIKLWECALQSERRNLEGLREKQICAIQKIDN